MGCHLIHEKKMTPATVHQKLAVLNVAAGYNAVASHGPKAMNNLSISFLRHLRVNAFSFVLLFVCTMTSGWIEKGLREVIWGLGNTKLQFPLRRPSKIQQECSFLVASSLLHRLLWEVIRIRDTLTNCCFGLVWFLLCF